MSIHIGLMIWKEMKQQEITIAFLAQKLGISLRKTQAIINSESADINMLLAISKVLKFNFLTYYDTSGIGDNSQDEKKKSSKEINRLKNLLAEKNRMIKLKEKIILNLSNTVSILEKVQYN